MGMMEDIRKLDKKNVFATNKATVSYPTGFAAIDYANGSWASHITEDGTEIFMPKLGVKAGSIISVIGTTGVGKSTFSTQIAWNVAKRFEDSTVHIVDCEKTMDYQRIVNLLQIPYDNDRVLLHQENTSIEDALDMINATCDIKESDKKRYQYRVEGKDTHDGKPVTLYIPTVYVIDSLPAFNSKEYNVDDLGTDVDQMKAAKHITRFFTNVLDKCWKYNIIIIHINHIKPMTITNPYAQPPQGLMMINSKTEQLPRGQSAYYFSSTYIRLRSNKSSAYTESDNGFSGYKCAGSLAKSKTNEMGTSVPLTFNTRRGYDPIYSVYEYADSLGLINGRNPYLFIGDLDSYKFNRKEFNHKMLIDESFRKAVLAFMQPYYENLLGPKISALREDTATDFDPTQLFEY